MTFLFLRSLLVNCGCALVAFSLSAQNTIGLVDYDAEVYNEGYALFFPDQQGTVFLLNECGQVVHQWSDTQYHPGQGIRFMDNGDLVRAGRDPAGANPLFTGGGTGQMVQRKDWENNVLWQYTLSSDTA